MSINNDNEPERVGAQDVEWSAGGVAAFVEAERADAIAAAELRGRERTETD